MKQNEFNHYVCELLLTMLDRNPEDGELEEVKAELTALMERFKPKQPARPRPTRGHLFPGRAF